MSTATLAWTNPTARADNTPLDPAQIASIDVFDDTGAGPQALQNLPGAQTTFTTGALNPGQHTFTVIVNDVQGNKSPPSNAASVTITGTTPAAAPQPVTNLTATVNP